MIKPTAATAASLALLLSSASFAHAQTAPAEAGLTASPRAAEKAAVAATPPRGWRVAQGVTVPRDAASPDEKGASNTQVTSPMDVGPFPDNQITSQPVIATEGGTAAFQKDVAALQRTLTELIQVKAEVKEAHWNVSGTLYYPLHLLLQEHYEGFEKITDKVAERLLAVGSSADGRLTTAVKTAAVPEIPGGFIDDAQVLRWFTLAYKKAGEETKQSIKDTNDVDPTTSNLLQEVEDLYAKYQWQMRAEFQKTSTNENTGMDINDGKPVQLPMGQQTAPQQK